MKKTRIYLIIILLSSIFVTSCSPKQNLKPDIQNSPVEYEEKAHESSEYNEDDIEPYINYFSIKDDNKITNMALKERNIDYLLSEDNLLSNKESIANFSAGNLKVNKTFNTVVPQELDVDLSYRKYLMPYDYFLINNDKVRIYNTPSFSGKVIDEANTFDKLKLVNEVKGEIIKDINSDKWFGVSWYNKDGKMLYGFIPENVGQIRSFRFSDMYNSLKELESELKKYKHGYISNYKDVNGPPPLTDGKAMDKYGMQAYQSAPAYFDLNNEENFRYIPDGMIVFILGEENGYFKVKSLDYEGEYWIPKKYISFDNNLDTLSKVIVVDTTNQNQSVFEKRGDRWTLISYTLATTGVKDKRKFETPIGRFKILEKKDRFFYLDDKSREIAGYAPYASRFAQGAYIHGVPVDFIKKDGKDVDPGIKEYLFTIGTIPRSHKCVRNYTSHAQFLYNWVDPNDTAVITIK